MLKKVTRNTSIISIGTAVSMALGFVRDVMVARFFGTSALLEAFIVSFRIPNLFRSICGEGFADSVATPVLSEYQDKKEELFTIGNSVLSFSAFFLLGVTLLGMVFAKLFVAILAPGFIADPYKFSLAVSFTRITFLYLFFIGISVNSFTILYSLKRFFIPAITPAFLNISFIVGLIIFRGFFDQYLLVVCVLAGGILQVLIPLWSLKRQGYVPRLVWRGLGKDRALQRMLRLFGPRAVSSVAYQLSVVVDTVFASFSPIVGEGAVAALWFANQYIHLPQALFIHSLCRVSIVDLSLLHSQNKLDDFKRLVVFSFQNAIFFIIPIAMVYLFLSQPIITVILHRGDFDTQSVAITASALFFYSFGLFFFCGSRLFINSFYALKDTAVPARITFFSLVLNATLNACLMFPLKVGGVALATSLSAMASFVLLHRALVRKIGAIDWQDTMSQLVKVLCLSFVVAATSRFLWEGLNLQVYLRALVTAVVSVSFFVVAGNILGLKQIRYVWQWTSRKK